jgi:hypothetical protein
MGRMRDLDAPLRASAHINLIVPGTCITMVSDLSCHSTETDEHHLTIVAYESCTSWQYIDDLFVETPRDFDTFEGPVYHQYAIQVTCSAFFDKLGAIPGLRLDQLSQGR